MRKKLAACGAGAGLILALFPGEVSQGPDLPERFAGYVSDRPNACPNGTGQPMPSILLKGEILAQRGAEAEEATRVDLKMQESICRAAIHIGTSLLSAVNNYNPKSGFRISILPEHNRLHGRPTGISAHPKGRDRWMDMDVIFVTEQDAHPSGPAAISRIDGIWEVDDNTYDRIQLRKIRLQEGGQVWDAQADRLHYNDEPNEVLVDPAEPVSTMDEFRARINATSAALETLNRIPLPTMATK